MSKYCLVFIAFVMSLITSTPSFSVEVKDLYVAKVSVASQSRKDRNNALKQAMRLVLVKVGGHKNVLDNQAIKQNLRAYNQFVTNYRYERINNEQFLQASFDSSKINNLFVNENLPMWGSLRPKVVLWLVNENGLLREAVTSENNPKLTHAVDDFSSRRGLPIEMPQLSQTADDSLTLSDIWGRFKEPIYHSSAPYLPEAIVIVRLSDNTLLSQEQVTLMKGCELLCQQAIALDWSFISTANNDETQRFSERYYGVDSIELLTQALGDITDDIYQRYALTTNEKHQFFMDVANVDSLARYVKVSQFLQNLSAVQSVQLVSAIGSKRRFSLTLLGTEQSLLASLKLNNILTQYIDPLDPQSQGEIPIFYWEQP